MGIGAGESDRFGEYEFTWIVSEWPTLFERSCRSLATGGLRLRPVSNTLKHVSVLYEFSTLIEPEDVSASPRPVDPATLESARKPVGYQSVPGRWRRSFSDGPNVFTAFQEPSACSNTVDAI